MPERSRITKLMLNYLPAAERRVSPLKGATIGMVSSFAAIVLRHLIDPFVEGVPFITFFPLLAIASMFGGLWGGITSLLLDTVVALYAWLPPRGSLEILGSTGVNIVAFLLSGGVLVVGFWALNEVLEALRRSQEKSHMVAIEMQHRLKNLLQLVQSISNMTVRDATSAEDHQERLNARIAALSRAVEAPRLGSAAVSIDLKTFLLSSLEPFGQERFTLRGPPVMITDDAGSMLALAVHELATNAAKYGSLSVPSGTISIDWNMNGNFAELRWIERGGPQVIKPTRNGFGTKLLMGAFRREKQSATVSFDPAGLRCTLPIPAKTSDSGLELQDTFAEEAPS